MENIGAVAMETVRTYNFFIIALTDRQVEECGGT